MYFQPQTEGYVAIVLPKLKEYDYVMNKLSTEEDYRLKRFTEKEKCST